MTIRSLGESNSRSLGAPRSPAAELASRESAAIPAASEQRSELSQLAPELSPEVRQFMAARGLIAPAAGACERRTGVLSLLTAARDLDAGNRASCAAAEGLDHAYGAGAESYAEHVELVLGRAEAALVAALGGAGHEQVSQLLGGGNPRSADLAAGLINLAREMRSPVAFPPLREEMARNVRSMMREYVAPAPPLSPEVRARMERVLDERFRITSPSSPRPEPGSSAVAIDNPGAAEDGEASRPSLTDLIGISTAHAADYVPVRYAPRSEESYALFREAAHLAGVPESWATSEGLHNILQRESDGWVGKPNYTYGPRSRSKGEWGNVIKELQRGRRTTKSSATGLGQLLLANVDRYYPSGRAGIGVPVEEAAGMLAYIKDRYGTPERAWQLYGVLHEGY